MWLLSFMLALLGFNLLCICTGRNASKVIGQSLPKGHTRLLTAGGWGLLLISLWLGLQQGEPTLAFVGWVVTLTAALATVILLLTYRPQILGLVVLSLKH
ncbi:DUF3325 domain-containing protein [Shewanella sp. A32]|uniref:DUF3325 domain-containing protein n=1 Tax=Shewanella sp. A32 TaxID=3031327 RepID=UPI0023B970DB|nr:DUF3325 domain-containing protein [Shewanella sp. A32]MDF0534964.1 DUF3325 domain-containing protein [Shewanella sp. A32]